MRKPLEMGRLEALVVNDENGFDMSGSDVSSTRPRVERERDERMELKAGDCAKARLNRLSSEPDGEALRPSVTGGGAGVGPYNSSILTTGITGKYFGTFTKTKPEIEWSDCHSGRGRGAEDASRSEVGPKLGCTLPVGEDQALVHELPRSMRLVRVKGQCKFCTKERVLSVAERNLYNKYEASTQNTYNTNIINDIILDANTHLVVTFKDFLIYDDATEFLKAYVPIREARLKVRELTEYYEKSSKVFANYIVLEEKTYMFKNIERKQKAINIMHKEAQAERQKKRVPKPEKRDSNKAQRLLTKGFFDDLSQDASKVNPLPLCQLPIADLVDKFISKDSMSQLNQTNCQSVEATFCAQRDSHAQPNPKEEKKQTLRVAATSSKPCIILNVNSKGEHVARVNNVVSPNGGGKQLGNGPSTVRHCGSQEQLHDHKAAGQCVAAKSSKNFKAESARSGRASAAGFYRSQEGEGPKLLQGGLAHSKGLTNLIQAEGSGHKQDHEGEGQKEKPKLRSKLPLPPNKNCDNQGHTQTLTRIQGHVQLPMHARPATALKQTAGAKAKEAPRATAKPLVLLNAKKDYLRSGTPQTCTAEANRKHLLVDNLRIEIAGGSVLRSTVPTTKPVPVKPKPIAPATVKGAGVVPVRIVTTGTKPESKVAPSKGGTSNLKARPPIANVPTQSTAAKVPGNGGAKAVPAAVRVQQPGKANTGGRCSADPTVRDKEKAREKERGKGQEKEKEKEKERQKASAEGLQKLQRQMGNPLTPTGLSTGSMARSKSKSSFPTPMLSPKAVLVHSKNPSQNPSQTQARDHAPIRNQAAKKAEMAVSNATPAKERNGKQSEPHVRPKCEKQTALNTKVHLLLKK